MDNKGVKRHFFFPSFFILFIFLFYSCVTIKDLSKNRVIENVPFYPQTEYQCGPASLAGVLNFWGVRITPEEIAEEIYSKSARGTLNIDIVLYAQRQGLKAIQYEGNIQDLRKNIDVGYPMIVFIDQGFSFYQANHFMVVIGYNEDGVIVNSGKDNEKFISEKDFVRSWRKTNFWSLLIKPNE